ncbi:MAG: alpha/beta hydrolase [Sphingomonas sp. SCN 67-18]|uniref:esterase/lipase family protein n=1 Tax=uncultured Sphingomonas sp. TaxID=158754 RepID=UPI00086C4265|nr:alpha/beta fold hydrolase [Sphingomonas sp. SCN 67-18]ODU17157.1 MAG: alpha/beta hydrolase [Sphingomonas sp. SCN 67-18]
MMTALSYRAAVRPAAPPLGKLLREVRVLADFRRGWRVGPALPVARRGCGQPVLVVPGFLASDGSTVMLRRTLRAAGYRAHGWGLGRNMGVRADMLERLDARLDRIAKGDGAPVMLVGWSLGGLIAREYAKHAPDRIDRVVTLGSPFSGDPRANHAWRLYELINRHPVDRPPLAVTLAEKPPVPTIALWSANDGVIAPDCARGRPGEADRAVEVACGHMGFTTDPDTINAILDALAE